MKNKKALIYCILGIGIIPPIFYSLQSWVSGTEFGSEELVEGLIFSVSVTFLISLSVFYISDLFEKKFPWEHTSTRKRIFLQLLTSIILGIIIMIVFMISFHHVFDGGIVANCELAPETKVHFFNNIVMTIVLTAVANLILEGGYLANQWKKSLIETEKFKRKNVQSQFESLKNQVNPHFLFNSLNALSSLVQTDPIKAEEFINEFAKIYRYVLDMKDKFLVPLQEEYHFIRSFIFLHKIRFGSNLQVDIQIDPSQYDSFIPPLSLQELIENAIKHNIVSKENPLQIDIFIEGNQLVVRNNIQRRMQPIQSTKTGHKNLVDRYKMLSSREPIFEHSDHFYSVKLPLIKEEE